MVRWGESAGCRVLTALSAQKKVVPRVTSTSPLTLFRLILRSAFFSSSYLSTSPSARRSPQFFILSRKSRHTLAREPLALSVCCGWCINISVGVCEYLTAIVVAFPPIDSRCFTSEYTRRRTELCCGTRLHPTLARPSHQCMHVCRTTSHTVLCVRRCHFSQSEYGAPCTRSNRFVILWVRSVCVCACLSVCLSVCPTVCLCVCVCVCVCVGPTSDDRKNTTKFHLSN